jgi:hypothetical protein
MTTAISFLLVEKNCLFGDFKVIDLIVEFRPVGAASSRDQVTIRLNNFLIAAGSRSLGFFNREP